MTMLRPETADWYVAVVRVTRDGMDHRHKSVTFETRLWFNPRSPGSGWWIGKPGECAALEKVIPGAEVVGLVTENFAPPKSTAGEAVLDAMEKRGGQ